MAPIIFGFSDDEEEDVAAGADDEDIGDEEEQGGGGGAGGGNRATINPPGALPEAKRLRLHEPPPIGVDWKLAPKVLMADGASAVDAAALKVFTYKEELGEFHARDEAVAFKVSDADDMVTYYLGADIPPGSFKSFETGIVCFDLEWNVVASMERQRPKGGGNGKVAVITLAKAVVGDEAADSLEACFVHLSSYIDFPEELRAVFKSDDVCAVPRSHANRRVFTR